LPVKGLQRRITSENLMLPIRLIKCLRMARKIINDFNPDVVVGVGGYASWPVTRAASRKKIPVLLQEQNSYPGLTNRMLAKKAEKICVAYSGMEKYFPENKILITGNPVREEIKNVLSKQETAKEFFRLNDSKPVVLVVGGSLGAFTINKAIHAALPGFANRQIQLIWQTGSYYHDIAVRAMKDYEQQNFRVFRFIDKMDLAYSAADLIISRAGAIAVSELCLVKKPVILIPSPNVAEDHQTKNAMALVSADAAIMLKDNEAVDKLGIVISKLIENNGKQQQLQTEIARLGFNNADEAIAQEIIKLFR
jgi:UDP-N-acetylglucosamine--N-acetylmuramyl-(pentapeptide) pyrophosphoryl-undecaprenol N-acetylglucosamine transferase